MATRTISDSGGTRNWNDTASWVEAAVPTSADDVVATATSGNVAVNVAASCRSIDLTGYVGTLSGSSAMAVGTTTAGPGNVAIRFVAGMTFTYTGAITLVSTSTTQQSINADGKTITSLQLTGAGCSYILTNQLLASSFLQIDSGSFDTGGYGMSLGSLVMTGTTTRSLQLRSSTIYINGTTGTLWNISGTGYTLVAPTGIIVFTDAGASGKTFAGNSEIYGSLLFYTGGAGAITLSGNNTFGKLGVVGYTSKTINFTASSTTTLYGGTDCFFSGSANNLVTCQSTVSGTAWNVTTTKRNVVCDYLSLKDSAASGSEGGGTMYAGSHSTNVSGNSGWVFLTFTIPFGGGPRWKRAMPTHRSFRL